MSSLRLEIDHLPHAETEWVVVKSPRATETPQTAPTNGVVLSLRARREALQRGHVPTVDVEFSDESGDSDSETARDISADMDARWDN